MRTKLTFTKLRYSELRIKYSSVQGLSLFVNAMETITRMEQISSQQEDNGVFKRVLSKVTLLYDVAPCNVTEIY